MSYYPRFDINIEYCHVREKILSHNEQLETLLVLHLPYDSECASRTLAPKESPTVPWQALNVRLESNLTL